MKTFDKTYIRVLDHLLGVKKHLSVFFQTVSQIKIEYGFLVNYLLHAFANFAL